MLYVREILHKKIESSPFVYVVILRERPGSLIRVGFVHGTRVGRFVLSRLRVSVMLPLVYFLNPDVFLGEYRFSQTGLKAFVNVSFTRVLGPVFLLRLLRMSVV